MTFSFCSLVHLLTHIQPSNSQLLQSFSFVCLNYTDPIRFYCVPRVAFFRYNRYQYNDYCFFLFAFGKSLAGRGKHVCRNYFKLMSYFILVFGGTVSNIIFFITIITSSRTTVISASIATVLPDDNT